MRKEQPLQKVTITRDFTHRNAEVSFGRFFFFNFIYCTLRFRLSKYPLLLERLIDSEEKNRQRDPEFSQVELNKLKQAHDRSKEILNHVNEAAKIACNRARLEEIQRHLDTSIFEKTDHNIVNEFKVSTMRFV